MRHFTCLCCVSLLLARAAAEQPALSEGGGPLATATVGMAGEIRELVLPGSELVVRTDMPADYPLVLRIKAVYPHGTDHRYTLVYYGLAPGQYDLRECLRRADGTSIDDLPAIPVTVTAVLPAGQIEPHRLSAEPGPKLRGYRAVMIAAGAVWLAGLTAILLVRRHKKLAQRAATRPLTLADQLRPLLASAVEGTLLDADRARLERLLLAYWRKRRGLAGVDAATAMAQLRDDPEAGPLVRQVELWLHAPPAASAVDVAALLRPYQHLPAEPDEPAGDAAPALAGGGAR